MIRSPSEFDDSLSYSSFESDIESPKKKNSSKRIHSPSQERPEPKSTPAPKLAAESQSTSQDNQSSRSDDASLTVGQRPNVQRPMSRPEEGEIKSDSARLFRLET